MLALPFLAGNGGKIDDAAGVAGAHRGHHRFATQERAGQIDVEGAAPVGEAVIFDCHVRPGDPGGVHQNIYLAEFGDQPGHAGGDLRLIGDVDLLVGLVGQIPGHDRRARCDKTRANRLADAAPRRRRSGRRVLRDRSGSSLTCLRLCDKGVAFGDRDLCRGQCLSSPFFRAERRQPFRVRNFQADRQIGR